MCRGAKRAHACARMGLSTISAARKLTAQLCIRVQHTAVSYQAQCTSIILVVYVPGMLRCTRVHPVPHGFWFSTSHLFALDLGFVAREKRCMLLRAKQYQDRCSIGGFRDTACASLVVLPCRTPHAVVAVGVRSTVVVFCKCISTDASVNLFQTMPTLAGLRL